MSEIPWKTLYLELSGAIMGDEDHMFYAHWSESHREAMRTARSYRSDAAMMEAAQIIRAADEVIEEMAAEQAKLEAKEKAPAPEGTEAQLEINYGCCAVCGRKLDKFGLCPDA